MKITAGIIVLNGGLFLKPALESIYDVVDYICIAYGPVQWWVDQGVTESDPETQELLKSFPDPKNKIRMVKGAFLEKTEQCQAMFALVPIDTDYLLCVDADEVHRPENVETLIRFLEAEKPTRVGFMSDTFFGGFDRIIGGFEREHSFTRVLKYEPGCYYKTHRQPTLAIGDKDIAGKDINGKQLYKATGLTMWHGSYVSPKQVYDKIRYYEAAVIKPGQCIPDYFQKVFMKWVQNPNQRKEVERIYSGVHEFVPSCRGLAQTLEYEGVHPAVIRKYMPEFLEKINEEIKQFSI